MKKQRKKERFLSFLYEVSSMKLLISLSGGILISAALTTYFTAQTLFICLFIWWQLYQDNLHTIKLTFSLAFNICRVMQSSPLSNSRNPTPLAVTSSPASSCSPQQPICFLSLWICLSWVLHINKIIQYVVLVTGFFQLAYFQGSSL